MRIWLLLVGMSCLCGCDQNLGGADAPEKFAREVQDQFDQQIEAVRQDASKSDPEKQQEIDRIERERASFEAYNRDG